MTLTRFVSTAFTNGLLPGGLGFDTSSDTGHIAVGSANPRHGNWAEFESSSTGRSMRKFISATTFVLTFDVWMANYPAVFGTFLRVRTIQGQNPNIELSMKTTGKLTAAIFNASNVSVASTVDSPALPLNALSTVSVRFTSSSTSWTAEFTIYNSSGTVTYTSAQAVATGMTANYDWHLFDFGPLGGSNLWPLKVGNVELSEQAGDYPLAPVTADDTHVFQTVPTETWLDHPDLIHGGYLFGHNTTYGSGSNLQFLHKATGPLKANRNVYVTHSAYSPLTPPPSLGGEAMMLDGTALGYQCWPIIGFLGFDGLSTGWPAGGLADFTSGSMNSTLDAWATLFNTLPPTPVPVRLWREMVDPGTIYGPAGSTRTPNHGVNETSTTYVAAWRYVVTYMRARCPWLRFVWCPNTRSASALSQTSPWYPGDAYVDWIGLDSYVGSSALQIEANTLPIYGGFNPINGTVTRNKPMMICETQTDRNDATRVSDIHHYTTGAAAMPGATVWCFWDTSQFGQYEVVDQGDSYPAEYQSVVQAAPFGGVPTTRTWPAPGKDGHRKAAGDTGRRKHGLISDGTREAG